MMAMEAVIWLTNFILVIPLLVTGASIRQRHFLIAPTIGAFDEEIHAFNLATFLMWILPVSISVVCLLDLALFHFYNMNYHPWKNILMEDKSGFRKKPTIRNKQQPTTDNKI